MNVLVIAPHPDDETIGCGGTLCLHAEQGDNVSVVFLTSGELGLKHLPREEAWVIREREARKAAQLLKISVHAFLRRRDWFLKQEIRNTAELLRPIVRLLQPHFIYLPHAQDDHPDHQVVLPMVKAACAGKAAGKRPLLRLYETWTPLPRFDAVQDISPYMERKLRALRAHRSQLKDFNYVRAVIGLNQYRGALAAKCNFAEVFAEVQL